jgi:multiple sugar transport system permease protein
MSAGAPAIIPTVDSKLQYSAATKKSRKRGSNKWIVFVALCLICCGYILPLLWMLSTSLKTLDKTMEYPPHFVPDRIEMHPGTPFPQNYWRVITHDKMDFPLYTRNTVIVAALSVLGTVFSCSLAAYAFAKIPFRGRGTLFGIMLATMMIPFTVKMIPLFNIFRWLGDHTPFPMLGTLRPLWLPTFFGTAFCIFLLRQFYMTIPDELSEAARIDGCNEFGIWWRIILPLSRPALAVVALFTFLWSWNDFLGPLIYIQDPDHYTLALGLQVFQSTHGGTEWNLLMAASLLILLPVIILFFLAQKTFIQGIATTGMKG